VHQRRQIANRRVVQIDCWSAAARALWRMQKTVALSGHSLHPQKPSPVSGGFVPPVMADHIGFRPEALAAAMARTLTLRAAAPALLHHWIRSQLAEVEYLVADGARFALSPDITALADAERSAFAGRVGAGVTDLLMNALGYVWRDNGACLSGITDPHADFIYAGGAVTGHGVVLAEAHGSFAQSVSGSRMSGEAKRKYRRQILSSNVSSIVGPRTRPNTDCECSGHSFEIRPHSRFVKMAGNRAEAGAVQFVGQLSDLGGIEKNTC
jgi:hypothetical protein